LHIHAQLCDFIYNYPQLKPILPLDASSHTILIEVRNQGTRL
jgi:hypothetical protein